jgi:hypothetical protein
MNTRRSNPRVVPASAMPAAYAAAFAEIVARIQAGLARTVRTSPRASAPPIAMYVAGGAAQMFYTAARVSMDIDASFSRRILLPEDLEVVYHDAAGAARTLYFDRQYNDSFALLHEDVYDDSWPLPLPGIDAKVIDVRLFAPVDLAVSKLARYAEHDQTDIAALARAGLITSNAVRERAEHALVAYVGDLRRVKTSIRLACELIGEETGTTGRGATPVKKAGASRAARAGTGRKRAR